MACRGLRPLFAMQIVLRDGLHRRRRVLRASAAKATELSSDACSILSRRRLIAARFAQGRPQSAHRPRSGQASANVEWPVVASAQAVQFHKHGLQHSALPLRSDKSSSHHASVLSVVRLTRVTTPRVAPPPSPPRILQSVCGLARRTATKTRDA